MYKTLLIFCLTMTINLCGVECPLKMKVHIEAYTGNEIVAHTQEIVNLITHTYINYPYYNQIDEAAYTECMHYFAQSKTVVICVAYINETPVGIASGIAMREMPYFYKTPFYTNEQTFDTLYNIGEFGVVPDLKGLGIEKKLSKNLESYAKENNYTGVCRFEMDANEDGSGYPPKTEFWENRGYVKNEAMDLDLTWKNIGDDQESSHRAVYMFKKL